MPKKFKVIFPDKIPKNKSNTDKNELIIKSILKNTANGVLGKILIFLYQYEPCSKKEIADMLSSFYQTHYDPSNVKMYLNQLNSLGLVSFRESQSILESTSTDPETAILKQKHGEFLEHIPLPFRKNFSNVHYYKTTHYSETFLKWCAEIAGVGIEE